MHSKYKIFAFPGKLMSLNLPICISNQNLLNLTFRMASGKFLLKNRITSLTLAVVLVRTVIMYPSPNLKKINIKEQTVSLQFIRQLHSCITHYSS